MCEEFDNEYLDEEFQQYSMNVLEEYIGLFGNPYNQTMAEIIANVNSLEWPKEEILNLFNELLDETYEHLMREDEVVKLNLFHDKIEECEKNVKLLIKK